MSMTEAILNGMDEEQLMLLDGDSGGGVTHAEYSAFVVCDPAGWRWRRGQLARTHPPYIRAPHPARADRHPHQMDEGGTLEDLLPGGLFLRHDDWKSNVLSCRRRQSQIQYHSYKLPLFPRQPTTKPSTKRSATPERVGPLSIATCSKDTDAFLSLRASARPQIGDL